MCKAITAFLQFEQNSKLHVGHSTERGSNMVALDDDEGCRTANCVDVEGDNLSSVEMEQIVSQFLFGHHSLVLSHSTSTQIKVKLDENKL